MQGNGVDLKQNYLTMMKAVSTQLEAGKSSVELVGMLDDPKLRSSVRLFEKVSRDGYDEEVHTVCVHTLAALKEDADD